jgi:hypothetical protein
MTGIRNGIGWRHTCFFHLFRHYSRPTSDLTLSRILIYTMNLTKTSKCIFFFFPRYLSGSSRVGCITRSFLFLTRPSNAIAACVVVQSINCTLINVKRWWLFNGEYKPLMEPDYFAWLPVELLGWWYWSAITSQYWLKSSSYQHIIPFSDQR